MQQPRSSARVWNLSWEVIPLIHRRFIVSYYIQIQKRPALKITSVERFICFQPQAFVSCVFVRVRACEHPGCVAIAGGLCCFLLRFARPSWGLRKSAVLITLQGRNLNGSVDRVSSNRTGVELGEGTCALRCSCSSN